LNCTCDVFTQRFIGDATKQKVNTTFFTAPSHCLLRQLGRANADVEPWWSCTLSRHKCWAMPVHGCWPPYMCEALGWLSGEPRQL